jgi:putative Mg2+ transporter-C (MgtC) family protein
MFALLVELPTQQLHGTSFAHQIAKRLKDAAVGEEVWSALVKEFSDVPDASTITRITVRLVVAAVLGGVLGFERESKGRSAGLRTHMLVAVGAALFVLGPLQSGMQIGDLSRVLQGVVQGIGFLGAGAIIIRSAQREVEGLTTAASIWATAGIGVMAGLGMEVTAVLSTAIVLIILAAVPHVLPTRSETDSGSRGDD